MTTLDRAFIKAFGDSQSRAPLRATSGERVIAHGATLHAAAEKVARPRAHHGLASPLGPPGRIDPSAPLSSFASAAKIEPSFRAILEVDRLSWPDACCELLVHARASWERFGEQLCDRIAEDQKCIAMTSNRRCEGRTTIALATAKMLAARGMRPIVVDADFENPKLAESCGVSPNLGWGEVIEGDLPLGEALIAAIEDNVSLMPWRGPSGRFAQRSAQLRASANFRLLREHYDLVIIDALPITRMGGVSDLAQLAETIGLSSVYLVADTRSTSSHQVATACVRLAQAKLNVAGVIENYITSTAPPLDTREHSE